MLINVVAGVFGYILDPEFESNANVFKENFVETMRPHKPRVTPEQHVLIHHVRMYVCRTGSPLGPTSNRVLEGQHKAF